MKIKTLSDSKFLQACAALAARVGADYAPDVVVGILTGGGYVGREICRSLPPDARRRYWELKVQRTGTSLKERAGVRWILRHMPLGILNGLRQLESRLLERSSKRTTPMRQGEFAVPPELDVFLKSGGRKILLTDDAIDSGATMMWVKNQFIEQYKDLEIKVAVITVTTPHPLVDADYALYRDRVLVRFPWSNDMKRE